jgi:D-amino peptidase
MKLMIRTDVEGVTGVTSYDQAAHPGFGRAMLMNDVRAVLKGLLATGDHEIVIYDQHTDGRNLDLTELPESVTVICGKPPYRPDWGGIDSTFDAMVLVGFHARAGTAGALLAHSYSHHNLALRVNGTEVGEIGMEAAIAGDVDVPVWLVTGDSAGMAEAAELLPGVQTVAVKVAMGEKAALCYPPTRTAKALTAAAEAVMRTPPSVEPLSLTGPVTLEVDLADTPFRQALKDIHAELMEEEAVGTLTLEAPTVTEAWAWYLEIESEARAAMPR